MPDPTKLSAVRRSLNVLRAVAIIVFATVWSVQMYLSYFGPTRPSAASGAIYPVTIHGGVTYATHWESYFATQNAILVCFVLFGLNILLRRVFIPSRSF